MKLDHIELGNLKLSPLNVRKHGERSGDDLKPSIRKRGVLQPLLVRPNCEGFEIVAGQRRYDACKSLEAEGEVVEPLPCAIMEDGDDAAAIEASLMENIARLPMDEIDQYQAFAAMLGQGQAIEDIAASFGVTERLVNQRLAIGNLYEPILNAYRREEIRPDTLRILTMASTRQQKAWWKLFKDEEQYAPTGHALKDWLFGGNHIPVENARFDVAEYTGTIISDLFSEERYFGDSGQFWERQNTAVAALAERFHTEGWADVIVHEAGTHWPKWNYIKTPKEKGGAVHITCTADGEVSIHEGYLPEKEVRRRQKQQDKESGKADAKPELTQAMQNYLDLHRHNAVRVELLKHQDIALRLMVAHAIAGSGLWRVEAEPQKTAKAETDQSLSDSDAHASFHEEAADVRDLLGIEDGGDVVDHAHYQGRDLADIFARLLTMDDDAVRRVLTFVMAETLQSGTGIIEQLGTMLAVDMRQHWQPDETFFELLRDKPTINAMVKELAGKPAADGNITSTAKVQKAILKACLSGERKPKVEDWQPRYMDFPMRAYSKRGGIGAMDKYAAIAGHFNAS